MVPPKSSDVVYGVTSEHEGFEDVLARISPERKVVWKRGRKVFAIVMTSMEMRAGFHGAEKVSVRPYSMMCRLAESKDNEWVGVPAGITGIENARVTIRDWTKILWGVGEAESVEFEEVLKDRRQLKRRGREKAPAMNTLVRASDAFPESDDA